MTPGEDDTAHGFLCHPSAIQRYQHDKDDRMRGATWEGSNMVCLTGGSTTDDVAELAAFIDGIHAWGEGVYARGVLKDVGIICPSVGLDKV